MRSDKKTIFIQTITPINRKGRGGKTTQKRLTKITNYFSKKEGLFK
jgi:hypothetical protein